MKKIFTILALFLGAITVSADDFTDVLSVDINGAVTEQYATISLRDSSNGKYIFSLKNFVLKAGTNSIGVGTIELQDVEGVTDANGVLTLTTNQKAAIKKGDDPQVTTWMGPMLGNVPIELKTRQHPLCRYQHRHEGSVGSDNKSYFRQWRLSDSQLRLRNLPKIHRKNGRFFLTQGC